MAYPLRTTASVTAIIQLSSEVVRNISGAVGAAKERKRLRNEVRACEFILQQLNDEINDADEGRTWSETIKALEGDNTPLNELWVTLTHVKAKLEPKGDLEKALTILKWPFDEQEVERIVSILGHAKGLLELALTNDCRKLAQEVEKNLDKNGMQLLQLTQATEKSSNENEKRLAELKDGIGGLSQRQRDQERRSILNWLTPVDYAPQQNDFISRRQEGTDQWLLDSAEFQAWLETNNQTLFCPGIAGTGKTIMTAVVVDYLCTRFRNDASIGIAYLYCNFRRQHEQRTQDLLASLLKQLVQGQSSTPDTVKALYDRHKDEWTQSSLDEISKALHSVTAIYSRVFIIIDALDECAVDACRTRLLPEIFNLQGKTGANLFVTSRPTLETTEKFKESVSLTIRASNNDVGRYLDSHAMERVEGQFTDAEVLAKQVLSWITCAKRPLTTSELRHALAVEIGESQLDEENLPETGDMVTVCAGLVTVDKESNIIRLVHYTAQEYFQRTQKDWFPEAETDIVKVCVTYLSFNVFDCGFCQTDEEFEARLRSNIFYDYAARNWGHHAHAASTETEESILHFLESGAKVSSSSQAMVASRNYSGYSQKVPRQMTGVHLAAYFGLKKTIIALFANRHAPDLKDSYGWTPLSLAAKQGHEAVANLLLAEGVDPDSKDSQNGQTPLSWAAANGYEVLVKVLLEQGVDADSKDTNNRTPLSWAAANGHEVVMKLLLEQGVDAESKDASNRTPLSLAATNGHKVVVKLLLIKGVNPDSKDTSNRTPLSWAAANGHEGVVKLLLAKDGVDPESKDASNRTPLLWAVQNGHEAVVKLLLEKGADVTVASNNGRTPLYMASRKGRTKIVKLLLEKGADVTVTSKTGWTPLNSAANNGHVEIVKLLLEKGADITVASKTGWTPLNSAASNGHVEIVKLLLEKGADVTVASKEGWTPLNSAASNGHVEIVKLLLEKGADVTVANKDGSTPLNLAAYNGHVKVVKLLLEEGADVTVADKDGSTPLNSAAYSGNVEVVKLLLEKGADLESRNYCGQTPLLRAAASGKEAVVKLLLAKDVAGLKDKDYIGRTSLLLAAENGHESVVKLLLAKDGVELDSNKDGRTLLSEIVEEGLEALQKLLLAETTLIPDSKSKSGYTPLWWAAEKGHEAVVKLLLAKDNVDPDSKDRWGRTPLLWAAENGHEAVVKLFLAKGGVDINSKDAHAEYGQTPLSWAAKNGHEAVVKLLLAEDGVDPDSKDNDSRTPLSRAAENGHEAVVKLLLAKDGVDPNSRDNKGRTPLRWAKEKRNEAVVKLLSAALGSQK
ncbi:hypothetical protein DL770_000392 [Monosporascus sp. CRB-9-2]|nr:hypothetical protein DL770_000392 [Monosporascus sp. CRB-9-2]